MNLGDFDTDLPTVSSRKWGFGEQMMTGNVTLTCLWQWSKMQQMLNGTPLYMFQDCAVQEGGDTDHWLRSNWIYRGEEDFQVFVELQFTMRDCKSFGEAGPLGCKETFNLLYMQSDQDVGVQLRRSMFQKVLSLLSAILVLTMLFASLLSMCPLS